MHPWHRLVLWWLLGPPLSKEWHHVVWSNQSFWLVFWLFFLAIMRTSIQSFWLAAPWAIVFEGSSLDWRSKVFDLFFGGSLGHPDFRQSGDLLKAGCLTCYLVALRAVLASIIVATFFVSMSFCGGSMVSISGGEGSDRKKFFSRIYKIHSYLGRIVGSNFEGGEADRSPTSHKVSGRTNFV